LSGINTVPFEYRSKKVLFLAPEITWNSKPCDVALLYGFPENVSPVSEITGERKFEYNMVYDGKPVKIFADNGGAVNSEFHSYTFVVDCKTAEEAQKFFEDSHTKMQEFYKKEENFEFEGRTENSEYYYSDGTPCSYTGTYEDGKEAIFIMDEDTGRLIPLEEAKGIIIEKEVIYEYVTWSGAVGFSHKIRLEDNESSVYIYVDFQY
ncbi:MAG: hypothetical protein IKC01_01050, partial [Clostridia bacterium]|nr:hypothetical protein [Clostridia bacterium]